MDRSGHCMDCGFNPVAQGLDGLMNSKLVLAAIFWIASPLCLGLVGRWEAAAVWGCILCFITGIICAVASGDA